MRRYLDSSQNCLLKASLKGALAALLVLASLQVQAFDFFSSTKVGSWQMREDVTADHKGRQTASVIRSAIVGKEMRSSEMHYWLEMEIETFKIKKNGQRKQQGDAIIIKSLVAESVLNTKAENVIHDLRGFGVEMIIQQGSQDPMLVSGGGAVAQSMLNAMGAEIEYKYEKLGSESVEVKAGQFQCDRYKGSGSAEFKVLIKNMRVDSESSICLSAKVPFGLIQSESTALTNGKLSTTKSQLLEFGMAGAVSKITKTPQQAPSLNIFN